MADRDEDLDGAVANHETCLVFWYLSQDEILHDLALTLVDSGAREPHRVAALLTKFVRRIGDTVIDSGTGALPDSHHGLVSDLFHETLSHRVNWHLLAQVLIDQAVSFDDG